LSAAGSGVNAEIDYSNSRAIFCKQMSNGCSNTGSGTGYQGDFSVEWDSDVDLYVTHFNFLICFRDGFSGFFA